jgi:hypothetical protein
MEGSGCVVISPEVGDVHGASGAHEHEPGALRVDHDRVEAASGKDPH